MKFVLNTRKGTTLNHPYVRLPGGMAVIVPNRIAHQLKNYRDVVVFDEVAGAKLDDITNNVYGLSEQDMEFAEKDVWKYTDFVKQMKGTGRNPAQIAELWQEYKKKKGITTIAEQIAEKRAEKIKDNEVENGERNDNSSTR